MRHLLIAVAVLVLSLVAVGLVIAGCLTSLPSSAGSSGRDADPTPQTPAATTDPVQRLNPEPAVAGARSTLAVSRTAKPRPPTAAVGDCVGGTAEKVDCGSGTANYRVVDAVPEGGHCPRDVDQSRQLENGSLCLDVDWQVGGCMDLSGEPKHLDCATPEAKAGVRVLGIRQGTTDVNSCPTGNRGIVYEERRFVVCVGGG